MVCLKERGRKERHIYSIQRYLMLSFWREHLGHNAWCLRKYVEIIECIYFIYILETRKERVTLYYCVSVLDCGTICGKNFATEKCTLLSEINLPSLFLDPTANFNQSANTAPIPFNGSALVDPINNLYKFCTFIQSTPLSVFHIRHAPVTLHVWISL